MLATITRISGRQISSAYFPAIRTSIQAVNRSTHSIHNNNTQVLRLRGIPFFAREDDITTFFHGVNLNSVHMLFSPYGELSGEALVVVDKNDVQTARSYNGYKMGPRFIEIMPATDGELQWALKRCSKLDALVRLSSLPPTVDQTIMEEFFEGLPVAENGIGILTDRDGRPTGEAFVQFASPEAANDALTLSLTGSIPSPIRVRPTNLSGALTNIRQQMYKNIGIQSWIDSQNGLVWLNPRWLIQLSNNSTTVPPVSDVPATDTGFMEDKPLESRSFPLALMEATGLTIRSGLVDPFPYYIRTPIDPAVLQNQLLYHVSMLGLPFSVTVDDIIDFFHPLEISHLVLRTTRNSGIGTGTGDAFFLTKEMAAAALKRDRKYMGSRYVELSSRNVFFKTALHF